MFRFGTAALFVTLVGLVALRGEDTKVDKSSFDAKKLVGTYTIVSGQRGGKDLPKSDFDGSVVTFTKEKIFGHDKDKKEFFGATYTVDADKSPVVIHMTSTAPKKGEKAEGVIEMAGDTVKLCYALPGGKAPTSFQAGKDQQCFILKRKDKVGK